MKNMKGYPKPSLKINFDLPRGGAGGSGATWGYYQNTKITGITIHFLAESCGVALAW